jgi:hypothetical protein
MISKQIINLIDLIESVESASPIAGNNNIPPVSPSIGLLTGGIILPNIKIKNKKVKLLSDLT